MKGLLVKDFMIQKKTILIGMITCFGVSFFCILVMLSIYYGNFRKDLIEQGFLDEEFIGGVTHMMAFWIAALSSSSAGVTTVFGGDMEADFGKVVQALPVTTGQRTFARYTFYVLFLAVMFVCNLLFIPVIFAVAEVEITGKLFIALLSGFAINLFLNLVDIPLIYRFGTNVPVYINVFIIILGIIGFIRYLARLGNLGQLAGVLAFSVPVLLLLGLPVSYAVSCGIQNKRRNRLW